MVPRKVAEYYTAFNLVTEDLLENIEATKDSETSALKDVTELLFRWSFECEWLWLVYFYTCYRITVT